MKKLLFVAGLLVLLFGFSKNNASADEVTTIYQVDNLTCSSCLVHIGGELQKFEGYIGMKADLSRGLIHVIHDSGLDENALANFITVIGYPARVIPSEQEKALMKVVPGGKSGCKSPNCGATAESWKKLVKKITGK